MRICGTIFVVMLLCLLPAPAGAGEISPAGKKLGEFFDGLNVEKLWLAGSAVNWKTGEPLGHPATRPASQPATMPATGESSDVSPGATSGMLPGAGGHTHCTLVAAACMRKGVYILRPPEHSSVLLANAQYDWLAEHGQEKGWQQVHTAAEAQRQANLGQLVVAVFKAKDPAKPGHAALVRPSDKSDELLAEEGPQIVQAERTNYNSVSMKEGFKHHPTAWKDGLVAFYVHELKWE